MFHLHVCPHLWKIATVSKAVLIMRPTKALASVIFFVSVLIFILKEINKGKILLNTYEENLTMANLPWS